MSSKEEFIEVDELDYRLGLIQLICTNNRLTRESTSIINSLIHETKMRALKDSLRIYREGSVNLTHSELINEKHKSKRLGDFLKASGYDRPTQDFEAHAIVSGQHFRAVAAREILASFDLRIDDPINGVWLPNFKRNLDKYKEYSSSHRSIHKRWYYINITDCLQQAMSKDHASAILRRVAQGLITGSFPIDRKMRAKEVRDFVS